MFLIGPKAAQNRVNGFAANARALLARPTEEATAAIEAEEFHTGSISQRARDAPRIEVAAATDTKPEEPRTIYT